MEKINKVINALEKNNINGIYAKSKCEAVKIVEQMLFEGCLITAGGSVSLHQSGVWDLINSPCYNFLDRNK